ncbi:MAG: hypothetical protein MHM6MM_005957 [Cercozoa sp. M6MM]
MPLSMLGVRGLSSGTEQRLSDDLVPNCRLRGGANARCWLVDGRPTTREAVELQLTTWGYSISRSGPDSRCSAVQGLRSYKFRMIKDFKVRACRRIEVLKHASLRFTVAAFRCNLLSNSPKALNDEDDDTDDETGKKRPRRRWRKKSAAIDFVDDEDKQPEANKRRRLKDDDSYLKAGAAIPPFVLKLRVGDSTLLVTEEDVELTTPSENDANQTVTKKIGSQLRIADGTFLEVHLLFQQDGSVSNTRLRLVAIIIVNIGKPKNRQANATHILHVRKGSALLTCDNSEGALIVPCIDSNNTAVSVLRFSGGTHLKHKVSTWSMRRDHATSRRCSRPLSEWGGQMSRRRASMPLSVLHNPLGIGKFVPPLTMSVPPYFVSHALAPIPLNQSHQDGTHADGQVSKGFEARASSKLPSEVCFFSGLALHLRRMNS